MKKPIKPRRPNKPSPPLKEFKRTIPLFEDYGASKFSIKEIKEHWEDLSSKNDFGFEIISSDFNDVIINVESSYDGDVSVDVSVIAITKNDNYDEQLKAHKQAIRRYTKKYNQYKIDLNTYNNDIKTYEASSAKREIASLKKRLKDLEG